MYAFNTYDEERWFDMYVVPREQLAEVFTVDRGEPAEHAMTTGTATGSWTRARRLEAVRDLILVLADSKRLLGYPLRGVDAGRARAGNGDRVLVHGAGRVGPRAASCTRC